MAHSELFRKIYDRLLADYGPQGWWPLLSTGYHHGDYSYPRDERQRFEICVGAILTQNTAWTNVEKALFELESKVELTPETILELSLESLQRLIRPAGYFRQKAKKLKLFAQFFLDLKGGTPSREGLLGVWGVGPETADSILLYAYAVPTFVVDAYTKRIFSHLGLVAPEAKYDEVRALFQHAIPADVRVYQEYHALIVEHAKRFYGKRGDYGTCPLRSIIS